MKGMMNSMYVSGIGYVPQRIYVDFKRYNCVFIGQKIKDHIKIHKISDLQKAIYLLNNNSSYVYIEHNTAIKLWGISYEQSKSDIN